MDSIPSDVIFQFNEDTLECVRKDYDLDKPGVLNEAIDLLDDWVKKQDHFVKVDFPREYLERMILAAKGSVERAKKKLDKICTLRTMMPIFYETVNFKTQYKDSKTLMAALLPKLTREHYRVYFLKCNSGDNDNGFLNYFRFSISQAEYVWAHDYRRGIQLILDFTDCNLFDLVKKLDIMEYRQFLTLLIEGYGIRIIGIHVVSTSKAIETLLAICKQIMNPKVFGRIQIHKDYDSVYKLIDKDVLPIEAGGNETSLKEIQDQWLHVLSSSEFQEYFNKMKDAVVNEKCRQTDSFKNEQMGIAGTFRTLSVD